MRSADSTSPASASSSAPSATRMGSVPLIMPAHDDMTCVTRKSRNRHTTRHHQRESPALGSARQNRYTNPLHTASAGRRHTFAVTRLLLWYRDGEPVMARLPLLSTYLGHACISDTEVYLRITTALLQEANTRFHAFAEALLPAAGDQS